MMMKKTTSALAVAALLGTGAATAATFQIDDNTTFGVSGRVSPYYVESEGISSTTATQFGSVVETYSVTAAAAEDVDPRDLGTDGSGISRAATINSQVSQADLEAREVESQSEYKDTSRVIFSGTHSLNNGLTGFVNLELRTQGTTSNTGTAEATAAAASDSTELEARNAVIGVQGDAFGSASFGRQAGVYKKALGGYQDLSYFSGTSLPNNFSNRRSFQYSTPDLNGLTLHGEMQVNGDQQEAGYNDSSSSFAAAAVYNGANFTLTASYDQAAYIGRAASGTQFFATQADADAANVAYSVIELDGASDDFADGTDIFFTDAIAADDSDEEIMGAAFATNLAGVDVAVFTQVDGSQDEQQEISTTGLNLGYTVGNLSLQALVQNIDDETDTILADNSVVEAGSRTEVFLQSVYSLSDQMVIVGEYRQQDRQDDLGDTLAIGGVYNF